MATVDVELSAKIKEKFFGVEGIDARFAIGSFKCPSLFAISAASFYSQLSAATPKHLVPAKARPSNSAP